MTLAKIALAAFLVVFGVCYGFSLSFQYQPLIVGVLAIASGILIVDNK
jgi:phage shock protein PspC (stress-responsive transcriptional regulator)